MGDVVHTLPALTDAARAIPTIRFDWAVDEAFADIPAWHSHVERVFPVALRRWRADLTSAARRSADASRGSARAGRPRRDDTNGRGR